MELFKVVSLQRKSGIIKHFLIVHAFMTCLVLSAGIILLEAYNSFERLSLLLADVLFRLYAIVVIFSIHKKYDDEEKEKMANIEISSTVASENLSNAEAQGHQQKQTGLDKYSEMAGMFFGGLNLFLGVIAMPYFLYCVFTAYIHENQLKDSLVLLAIATMTTILALMLFVGIGQVSYGTFKPCKSLILMKFLAQIVLCPSYVDRECDSSHRGHHFCRFTNHPQRSRRAKNQRQTIRS